MRLGRLGREQEEKLRRKRGELRQVAEERRRVREINETKIRIIREEVENEKEKIREKYRLSLEQNKEEILKVKNQGGTFSKKSKNYKELIDKYQEMYREKENSKRPLEEQLRRLNGRIEARVGELLAKNRLINEKEKKIYQLKKETQELEKFKFVLNFTIKDLQTEIQPKEAEIKELQGAIRKEDDKLKNFNAINNNLEAVVKALRRNSEGMNKKILRSKEALRKINSRVEALRNFIFHNVQHILDYQKLRATLRGFPLKKIEEKVCDNQIDSEYLSQVGYLENSVNKFRFNIKKDSDLHKMDNRNYIQENIKLIKEILTLRRDLKKMKANEKPETINLRKNKKLRNIMSKHERELSFDSKVRLEKKQQSEIFELQARLEQLQAHPGTQ